MDGIRVLLVDDHTLVRRGLRALLQCLPGIQVVAEASDGEEALQLIPVHQPDVVLMDLAMPGLGGLAATARVAQEFPSVRVIIVSMHTVAEYVWQALRAGASGYILKDASVTELERAIRTVMRGKPALSAAATRGAVAYAVAHDTPHETGSVPLTPRQRQVLQLIAAGNTTKEIAHQLHRSIKTVETHRMQIMQRLNIHDMPGIDGTTLLRAALETIPDLVGIIMTGQGTIQTAVEAMRVGTFDYVLKPVTLAALLPVLARAMEVRRLRAARRTLEAQVREHAAALMHTNATLRQEIAERQRAEAALRRGEEYFRALTEHATDIIGILGEDGTVRYLSPALTAMLGYQPVELLGTPMTTLIHPDDVSGFQDALPRLLATPGAITHLGYRALHKDGSFRTLEVVGNNLLLDPAVAGVVLNVRDITERQEAARLKDDLLSVVSHELRTPLTSLRGFAELLLTRTLSPEKQQRFLTIIHDETVRLSDLITDFLDLQRMQAGRQPYRLVQTDLVVVLRDMVSLFTPASGPHVMRLEVQDALPAVHADVERLRQVLANLLSNALKFSPHGGEVIVGGRAQETQVLVWVTDHGLGIPPEAMPKLFSKFYRVEHHETRQIGGTGLGLALVKEIVEAHHGSVWVESTLGQGSTFFFTVPVALPAPEGSASDHLPSAAAAPSKPGEEKAP